MRTGGIVGAVLLVLASAAPASGEDVTHRGRAHVVDGDTIDVAGRRIRFHGIDAPEMDQECTRSNGKKWRCGLAARAVLSKMVKGKVVRCVVTGRDRHGRGLGRCSVEGRDLEAEMVRKGMALAYRQYSPDYVAEEAEASAARLGMWQGTFTPPWDWRHGR